MLRFVLAVVLLVGLMFCYASSVSAQCPTCVDVVTVPQTVLVPQQRTVLVPQVTYQQYQRSFYPRAYPTPLRRWFFGAGAYSYTPIPAPQPQPSGAAAPR